MAGQKRGEGNALKHVSLELINMINQLTVQNN